MMSTMIMMRPLCRLRLKKTQPRKRKESEMKASRVMKKLQCLFNPEAKYIIEPINHGREITLELSNFDMFVMTCRRSLPDSKRLGIIRLMTK
jgi:hypothetical protein